MSGGSFNYAYIKADDPTELLDGLDDYRAIEAWLRENKRHDAADEVLKFVLACETAQRRLAVMGKRISGILWAAEWTASGDTSIGAVDNEFAKIDSTQEAADHA